MVRASFCSIQPDTRSKTSSEYRCFLIILCLFCFVLQCVTLRIPYAILFYSNAFDFICFTHSFLLLFFSFFSFSILSLGLTGYG